MLFNIFTTSSPAKLAAATTTQAGSKSRRASPPPAPITKSSKFRGIFQKFRWVVARPKDAHYRHPQTASTHPQEGNNVSGFAPSSKIPYPIVPTINSAQLAPPVPVPATYKSALPTAASGPPPVLASDLATARNKIAELESTLCHLEHQKTSQIKGIHDMFYNTIVPTATAYVNELDAEAGARKVVEEQLEQETARHTKADELRLKEREQRWDAEEAKQKARREMETVREVTRKLEDQLLDLQVQNDHLRAEAFQEALKQLELVDASHQLGIRPTPGSCITPFIERLYADTGSDSERSWSSSWYGFDRITAGSDFQRAEGEETCSEESGERSRASPDASASFQRFNGALDWVNSGSCSPISGLPTEPLRRMPRGRQGGRMYAMRVTSCYGSDTDEDDFMDFLLR